MHPEFAQKVVEPTSPKSRKPRYGEIDLNKPRVAVDFPEFLILMSLLLEKNLTCRPDRRTLGEEHRHGIIEEQSQRATRGPQAHECSAALRRTEQPKERCIHEAPHRRSAVVGCVASVEKAAGSRGHDEAMGQVSSDQDSLHSFIRCGCYGQSAYDYEFTPLEHEVWPPDLVSSLRQPDNLDPEKGLRSRPSGSAWALARRRVFASHLKTSFGSHHRIVRQADKMEGLQKHCIENSSHRDGFAT
eukprot:g12060.t1